MSARRGRVKQLTSTSYAGLGLLAAPAADGLSARHAGRTGLQFVWPRAEARIYDEHRLLVEHGLALARRERTGRRPRTVYSITPEGRQAVRRWLAEPEAGPVLEYEALLKVAFAAAGTKADLLGHLSAIGGHAAARLATGRSRADEYASALVPLPEHVPVNGLIWNFLWQFYSAVEDWAALGGRRGHPLARRPAHDSRRGRQDYGPVPGRARHAPRTTRSTAGITRPQAAERRHGRLLKR
jgi:PadR family transcriptional regulator, regulatory protein AphA